MSKLILTTEEELKEIVSRAINDCLQNLPGTTPALTTQAEIIDTATLCTRLNISEPTIIKLRQRKEIPFLRIGSAVRYNYASVIEALGNRKTKKPQ